MKKRTELPANRHPKESETRVWPFEGKAVSRKSAIAYIAEVVLPDVDKSVSRKRVGERVRYVEKKDLVLTFRGDVVHPGFWYWAKDVWEALGAIPGYPTEPPRRLSESVGELAVASDVAFDFLIPGDLPRAQDELRRCHELIRQQDGELLRLLQESRQSDEVLRATSERLRATESELRKKQAADSRYHDQRVHSGNQAKDIKKRPN